jgi:hypothetical protein
MYDDFVANFTIRSVTSNLNRVFYQPGVGHARQASNLSIQSKRRKSIVTAHHVDVTHAHFTHEKHEQTECAPSPFYALPSIAPRRPYTTLRSPAIPHHWSTTCGLANAQKCICVL